MQMTSNKPQPLSIWYFFLLLFFLWALLSLVYHFVFYIPQQNERLKQALNQQTQSVKNSNAEKLSDKHKKLALNQNKGDEEFVAETIELNPTFSKGTPFSVDVSDNGKSLKLEPSEGFNFPINDFVHTLPMSSQLENNMMTLKKYVEEKPNNRLIITGKYLKDEKNVTMFPDLGIARANDIKNYLTQKGFDARQINVSSKIQEKTDNTVNNIVFSMIEMSIKSLNKDEIVDEKGSVSKIKTQIKKAPLVLTFDLGKSEVAMSEEQRQKMLKIVEYVGKTANAKVKVVGHTDSIGRAEKNHKLGLDRAKFAAKFMRDNGMPSHVIEISSLGETQPVASNKTLEGQIINRRTVVTVE